jgi:hypothetical protein
MSEDLGCVQPSACAVACCSDSPQRTSRGLGVSEPVQRVHSSPLTDVRQRCGSTPEAAAYAD